MPSIKYELKVYAVVVEDSLVKDDVRGEFDEEGKCEIWDDTQR